MERTLVRTSPSYSRFLPQGGIIHFRHAMTITVVVDDADPGIIYHGPWTTVDSGSSFINQSIGQSLHNSSGASTVGGVQGVSQFLYSFTGEVK